jgi:hypothetical protein
MIDNELRAMFLEREVLAPDPAHMASLIAVGIQRRRGRTRAVRVTVVAVAVLGLVTGVGVRAMGLLRFDGPPAAPNSPTPAPTASPAGGLVAAPDSRPTIAVQATWLPPDLTAPRIFADVHNNVAVGHGDIDSRSITYERLPSSDPGTESVTLQTVTAISASTSTSTPTEPNWVTHSDGATIDINGHTAGRYRMSSKSLGTRRCAITWQLHPDLWVSVDVGERTTDTTLNCDNGLRIALGVVERTQDLPRTVRLTMVPAGFVMAQTGTNLESWCPPGGDSGRCVSAQSGRNYGPAPGDPITVHHYPGTLSRRDGGFLLNVPGWIRIFSTSSNLTDMEVLTMAGTAVLDGGW